MINLNARTIIILTIVTITIWIGYEAYSTLTRTSRKITVRQELLRELNARENESVVEDLGTRISY